jgi:hypothetical protein
LQIEQVHTILEDIIENLKLEGIFDPTIQELIQQENLRNFTIFLP